ncbi:MAG: RluA family pseudouridine synthase [Saprospiraceae bacterium]
MKEEDFEDDFSDDLYEMQSLFIDPGQAPLRIDKYLLDRLKKVSRNRIQMAIKAGAVRVDQKEILKSNYKIKPGERIDILLPKPPEHTKGVTPQEIPLDIRYEDEDLLVLYKPPGLVVHPGVGNWDGTLVNALAYYFKDLPIMEGNSNDRLGLVHRIDKDTSGLMVVAKSDLALTALAKQFFDHTIDRTYLALVWGEPEEDEGTISGHIGRHPRFRKLFTVFPDGETGKWATTHYKVLERLCYVSLVECKLETGRTHQIRVHMRHLGHPLFNDERYGGDQVVKGTIYSKYKLFVERCFKIMPRQSLHAQSLGFVHPRTGEHLYFEAPLPADFAEVLATWRNYVEGKKTTLT